MNFISGIFIAFLLITLAGFYLLPSRARMCWLLMASYVFYATWSVPFIAIILITTTIDYILSHVIERNRASKTIARISVLTGVLLNLSMLFYFKYANFALTTISSVQHYFKLGASFLPEHLSILLPLGISFYTFEAISYLVDVYRGQKPAKNFLEYNFYIMYFPHLISGPIVRFSELCGQYGSRMELPSRQTFFSGLELILLGFTFKTLIANQVAPIADSCFTNLASATPLTVWVATLAFAVQLYFDFMSYTHIARGVSMLFNIQLPINFAHPFNASTVSEFWQRWHISLSRWIKDYLYIPLGGSRLGTARTVFNILLVMLIVGIWHGAGWTFAIFGLYHGILLSSYHVWKKVKGKFALELPSNIWSPLAHALTFLAIIPCFSIFRCQSLNDIGIAVTNLVRGGDAMRLAATELATGDLTSVISIGVLLALCFSGPVAVAVSARTLGTSPYWLRLSAACYLGVAIFIGTATDYKPFVYFQF